MRSAEIAGLEDEATAADGKESKGISAAAMKSNVEVPEEIKKRTII